MSASLHCTPRHGGESIPGYYTLSACDGQLGVTAKLAGHVELIKPVILARLGIAVEYWGQLLTELLKNNEHLLTV
jgi:hypothetical protein